MFTFARILLVALLAVAPTRVFAGPAEDAGPLFTRWKAAYDANDNVAVAKLYATDALLHGTRSRDVTVGRDAITKYFTVVVGTGNRSSSGNGTSGCSTTKRSWSLASTISCATRMARSRQSPPALRWFS
jgi:hypothetical protein